MRLPKLIIFFNLVITCKQSRILAVQVLWSAFQSRFTEQFSALSSTEVSLCRREAGRKRKKESARGTMGRGKGEERSPPFPSSHRPPRAFYFSIIATFSGIPKEASTKKRGFSVHYRYITMTTIHGHQKWSIRAARKWACPAPAPSPLTCEAWFLRSSMDRFLSHHRTQKLKVKLLPPIRSAIIYTSFYYLSLISNDLAQAFRA